MDIRFVQGFIDEIQRQKLVQKQVAGPPAPAGQVAYAATGSGPSGMIGQPGGGATGRLPRRTVEDPQVGIRPQTTYLGETVYPNTNATNRPMPTLGPIADRRMDLLEAQRGTVYPNTMPITDLAGQQTQTAGQVPVVTPDIVVAPSGEQVVLAQPSALFPVSPIDPQGHTGDVSPFRSQQRSEAVVAQHDAEVQGAGLGQIESEMASNRRTYVTLDAEVQRLYNLYGQDMTEAQAHEIMALENQMEAITAEQNELTGQRQEMYGTNPALALVGGAFSLVSEVVDKPIQTKLGEFGYWYVANMGDPTTTGAAIGMIANSPLGSVLAADGVGASDYVRWLEDHPDEVRVVQQDGYTDPQSGQHHTGGFALYEYYKDSLNLAQQVVTEAATSPTTYAELAAGAGGVAGRWGRAAAEAIPENTIAGRAARAGVRGTTAVVETGLRAPYMALDYAADEIVGGIGRGIKNVAMGTSRLPEIAGNIFRGTPDVTLDDGTVIRGANASGGVFGAVPRPNAAADTPLASQAQETIERIDAITRFRNTADQGLKGQEGPPITPPPTYAGGPPPVPPAQPGAAYTTPLPGDTVMIDTGQQPTWYRPDMPPSAAPTLEPPVLALPSGRIPTPGEPVGPIEPIGPRDWRNPNLVWNGTHWVEPPALPPALGAGPPPPEHVRLMNDWNAAQAYGDETGDYSLANILARQIDDLEQETAERLAPEPDIDLAPLGDEAAPDAYVSPTDVSVVRDRNSTDIFVGPDEMDIRVETIQVVNPRTGTSNRYIVTGPPTSPRGVRVTLDETEFTVQREAIARARRLVVGEEGPPATTAAPEDVIDPADIPTYRVNDDGTVTPVVDGEDLFDADFPSLYSEADARQAVRDLAAEPDVADVAPSSTTATGQETLPTDRLTKWRQWAVGRAKMYDDVLNRMASGDYADRGLADRVDGWFSWLERRIAERDARSGTPSRGQTPPGQSVADRAEDEIEFIRQVGEAPPEQKLRANANIQTFAAKLELAAFGSENQSRQARKWFHRSGNNAVPPGFVTDPEYTGPPVATYEDVTDYIDWLRQRRRDEIGASADLQRFGTNAGPDQPSIQERGARGRAARRLRAARLREAQRRNAAKLPGDTSRSVILADEEERLLNTKIADLGNVGRSDRWEGGATRVRGRGEGDQATVREVYDPVFNAARAAGDSIEVAHQKAMAEVSRRVIADFGNNQKDWWLTRAGDLLAGWHSQMSRYGDPVKFLRSAQGDWIGDSMQMFLSEGAVTTLKMNTMLLGHIKRGSGWGDTGAGSILRKRGIDPNSFSAGQGLVKAEQAGTSGGKSAAMKVATPKLWKLPQGLTDNKGNPLRAYAKGMDWMRSVNDKLEMTRREAAQIFLFDKELLRQSRDFHLVARRNRRLTQVLGVTDDDLKATVASLGTRFSRQDVSSGMERLARARGATAKDAATFGERIGRDWANIENAAYKQAKERVNKALFSYQYSNLDVKMRRFVPFHYWATRAIPFYTEAAIRNPALAYAYYELVKGLAERSEAEGWPDSLRFLVAVWTGPMGYIFFSDPVANMGLIGLTDMLFPYNDRDQTKSRLGRILDMATGRTGLGILPALTWPAAMMGMMGDDTFALDPTATYATRELYGGIINWGLANGLIPGADEGNILGKPFQQFMMDAREKVSAIAEDMNVPFAREIESTDAMAYTNQQIRNGMIDLRMQEQGYDNISQLTPEDWTLINEQYRAQDGNLYADAMADQATANMIDRVFMGTLVGTTPVRQEGMLTRQINQEGDLGPGGARRADPRGGPGQPEPGQEPTPLQAYETSANLEGRYGRTQGGISLPEYDPYADYQLTEGEIAFMELWYQETGERYQEGDLEAMRERTNMNETMARTTPEAAPYVAGEIGYYNLGPEGDGDLINEYWNIVFADPSIGSTFIGDQEYTYDQVKNMSDDERGQLADAWMADRDVTGSARRTMKLREAWLDAHPEYAAYKDWAKEIRDSYEGNIGAYRNDLISGNPNAARYLEDQARLARMEVDSNANPSGVNPETRLREGTSGTGSVEAYYAELDQRTLNLGAYLAINGTQRNIGDPKPDSTGEPGPAPGPYDPRPAGWAPPTDESGSGGSGGGTGGTGGGGTGRTGSAGTDTGRTEWATATIAASESGVAQANALLTQAMGYPVDIMDLPPPIRDAAMAQLPPGLIPEDAWLYFDYIAWQAHQELNNAPTDLGSYLAATANNRDWKATRSTFSAGGATLVGGTPAQVYRGDGTDAGASPVEPVNPYLNPYSNYFAGAP